MSTGLAGAPGVSGCPRHAPRGGTLRAPRAGPAATRLLFLGFGHRSLSESRVLSQPLPPLAWTLSGILGSGSEMGVRCRVLVGEVLGVDICE